MKRKNQKKDIFYSQQSDEWIKQTQDKGVLKFDDDLKRKEYVEDKCGKIILKENISKHICKKDNFFQISRGKDAVCDVSVCRFCLDLIRKKSKHACRQKTEVSKVLLTTRNIQFMKQFKDQYPILCKIDKKLRNAFLFAVLLKLGFSDPRYENFMNIYKRNLANAKLQKKNFRRVCFQKKLLQKQLGIPKTRHQYLRICSAIMVQHFEKKKWNYQTVQGLMSFEGFQDILPDPNPMQMLETFPYFCRLGWYINQPQKIKILQESKNKQFSDLGQFLKRQIEEDHAFIMDSELKYWGFNTLCMIGVFASNLPHGTFSKEQVNEFMARYNIDEFVEQGDIDDMVEIIFEHELGDQLFGFETKISQNTFYSECFKIYRDHTVLIQRINQNKQSMKKKQKQDIKVSLMKVEDFKKILEERDLNLKKNREDVKQIFGKNENVLEESSILSQAIILRDLCIENNLKNVCVEKLLKLPLQMQKNYLCSWSQILKRFPQLFVANHWIYHEKVYVCEYQDYQQLNCRIRSMIYARINKMLKERRYMDEDEFRDWYQKGDFSTFQRYTLKGETKVWENAKLRYTQLIQLMFNDGTLLVEQHKGRKRFKFNIYNTKCMYKGKQFNFSDIQKKVLKESMQDSIVSYDIKNLSNIQILKMWIQKYLGNNFTCWFIIGMHTIYKGFKWGQLKKMISNELVMGSQLLKESIQLLTHQQENEQKRYSLTQFIFEAKKNIKMAIYQENEFLQIVDKRVFHQYENMMICNESIETQRKKIKLFYQQYYHHKQLSKKYADSQLKTRISKKIAHFPNRFLQFFTQKWKREIGFKQIMRYLQKYDQSPELKRQINYQKIVDEYVVQFCKKMQLDIVHARRRQILQHYAIKHFDEWYFFIGYDLFIKHLNMALQFQKKCQGQNMIKHLSSYDEITEEFEIKPQQRLVIEYNLKNKQLPIRNSAQYKKQVEQIYSREKRKYALKRYQQQCFNNVWNEFIATTKPQDLQFESVLSQSFTYPSLVGMNQKKEGIVIDISVTQSQDQQRQNYLIQARKRRQKIQQKPQKKKDIRILRDEQIRQRNIITKGQSLCFTDKYESFQFYIDYVRGYQPHHCQKRDNVVQWQQFQKDVQKYEGYNVAYQGKQYNYRQMFYYHYYLKKNLSIDEAKQALHIVYRDLMIEPSYKAGMVFEYLINRKRIFPLEFKLDYWIKIDCTKIDKLEQPRKSKIEKMYFQKYGNYYHLFGSELKAIISVYNTQILCQNAFEIIDQNDQRFRMKMNQWEILQLQNKIQQNNEFEVVKQQYLTQKMEQQKDYDDDLYYIWDEKIKQTQRQINNQLRLIDENDFKPEKIWYECQQICFEQKQVELSKLDLFYGKRKHKCTLCSSDFIYLSEEEFIGKCSNEKCLNNKIKQIKEARNFALPILMKGKQVEIKMNFNQYIGSELNMIDQQIQSYQDKMISHQLIWMGSYDQMMIQVNLVSSFDEQIRNYFQNYVYLPLKAIQDENQIVIETTDQIQKGVIVGSLGGELWKRTQIMIRPDEKHFDVGMINDEKVVICPRNYHNHANYFGRANNLSIIWAIYFNETMNAKLGMFFVTKKKIKKNQILGIKY